MKKLETKMYPAEMQVFADEELVGVVDLDCAGDFTESEWQEDLEQRFPDATREEISGMLVSIGNATNEIFKK